MTQKPPQKPPHTPTGRPPAPPMPDLNGYRPIDERRPGAPPPIESRYRPPVEQAYAQPLRRVPARRKRSWLKAIAWTFGGLFVLAAAGVAALVFFAPVGILRDQLIREVEVRTGRTLAISGSTSLTVFPSLGVSMAGVTLSSPPAMGGGPFVRMKQLDIRVALMPLLSRKVEVERVHLTEPVFELRVDPRGRRNWDFAALAFSPTIQVAQAPAPSAGSPKSGQALPPELQDFLRNSTKPGDAAAPAAGSSRPAAGRASIPDIALGDIGIENGTVRYRDERTGLSEELRAIDARVIGRNLASPVETKGSLQLRGDRIEFDGRVGSPKALLEDRSSRVTLTVGSPRMKSRFDGSATLAGAPQVDGILKLETGSVRGLADWIGARLPPGPGLGAFSLDGELKTGAASVALNNANARLDAITASGSISVDLPAGRPLLKANLRLGALDLNPYLSADPAQAAAPSPQPSARPGSPAPPAPKASGPQAPGPQVKGFVSRSGWSDAPIDLSPLGVVDADVRLSVASILFKDIKVGATSGTAALKNRALKVNIDDVRLYDGQGRGVVTVEPSGQAAAIAANLSLAGVSGLPILKDAAGFDWIDGKARIQIAIAGSGPTERAIVETLNGKAEFGFADGAIIGFNLPQMIRGLSQGRLSGFSRVPTEKTDFSEAAASFQIRNGVAETKDLRASSPLIRLTGAGNVNLPQRQIDAVLRPKLVGSLTGQQGGAIPDLSGLELPIKVKGSWERPQVAPDVDGLLKNPNQAVDTIKEIGKQLQKGNLGGLNNLLEQFKRR